MCALACAASVGRPDQIGLIFDRRIFRKGPRATPGRFRTRVITDGVTPSLHADYKHTTIKQYHKEGKALRTETTINDTHDFGIGKRLTNLPALREIGFQANRRLLRVQTISHDPIVGIDALHAITDPVTTPPAPGSPGSGSGSSAAMPCSPPCRCSHCRPTASATATSGCSSRSYAALTPTPSPRAR